MWKDLLQSFPILGEWTIWRIENGKKVCIGVDSWLGAIDDYKLLENLRTLLRDKNILHLTDA